MLVQGIGNTAKQNAFFLATPVSHNLQLSPFAWTCHYKARWVKFVSASGYSRVCIQILLRIKTVVKKKQQKTRALSFCLLLLCNFVDSLVCQITKIHWTDQSHCTFVFYFKTNYYIQGYAVTEVWRHQHIAEENNESWRHLRNYQLRYVINHAVI